MSYDLRAEEIYNRSLLDLQREQDYYNQLNQATMDVPSQSVISQLYDKYSDGDGDGNVSSLDDYRKKQLLIEKLAAKKLKDTEKQAHTVGFSPTMGDGLGDLLVGAMLASIKKNVNYLFEKTRIFNEAQRVLGIDEDSPQYAQFKEFAKAHLKDFNFRKNDIYKPEVTGEMMARFSEQYPGLLSDEQKLAISRYNQDRGIEQKKEQSPSPSPQEVAKAAAALGITLNEALPSEHKDLIEVLKNGVDEGVLKGKDLEIANGLINTLQSDGDMSTKIMAIQNAFDNLSPAAKEVVDINIQTDKIVQQKLERSVAQKVDGVGLNDSVNETRTDTRELDKNLEAQAKKQATISGQPVDAEHKAENTMEQETPKSTARNNNTISYK